MLKMPEDSGGFTVAAAILTGVVASGLVAISIELANNYRHNLKRFVVLSEYLYMVSMYEYFVDWGSHGDYESFEGQTKTNWFEERITITPRIQAVARIILEFGPVIEDAVKTGREYLSVKELRCAQQAVDAADKLGEVIGKFICNHLLTRDCYLFDLLDEPLRSKIKGFAEKAGIYLDNNDLESIVCDYCLTNIDELGAISNDDDTNESDLFYRNQIIHCLWDFDQAMHRLQEFVKVEPVVYKHVKSHLR